MIMDEKEKPHAQLTLTVPYHKTASPGMAMVICDIRGCKDCLITALTALLLSNPDVKELVNKAVRGANEIKGRTQN